MVGYTMGKLNNMHSSTFKITPSFPSGIRQNVYGHSHGC